MRISTFLVVGALASGSLALAAGELTASAPQNAVAKGVEFAEETTIGPADIVAPVTVVKRVPPNFSNKLKRTCGEGSALVRFVVGRDGMMSQLTLVSATCAGLGKETMETVAKWRFKPATVNDRPVAAYYQVTWNYEFSQ